jgi:hypothetical protein
LETVWRRFSQGSVLESEVEEHAVEIDEENIATVKAASHDLLLLQKAECFLLRRIMKVRDAFDIYRLRQMGVVLNEQLENHLHDTLMNHEIEAEDISKRIAQVDEKRCPGELRSLLPPTVFDAHWHGNNSALCAMHFMSCTAAGWRTNNGLGNHNS